MIDINRQPLPFWLLVQHLVPGSAIGNLAWIVLLRKHSVVQCSTVLQCTLAIMATMPWSLHMISCWWLSRVSCGHSLYSTILRGLPEAVPCCWVSLTLAGSQKLYCIAKVAHSCTVLRFGHFSFAAQPLLQLEAVLPSTALSHRHGA